MGLEHTAKKIYVRKDQPLQLRRPSQKRRSLNGKRGGGGGGGGKGERGGGCSPDDARARLGSLRGHASDVQMADISAIVPSCCCCCCCCCCCVEGRRLELDAVPSARDDRSRGDDRGPTGSIERLGVTGTRRSRRILGLRMVMRR